jgi:hypothetical protein
MKLIDLLSEIEIDNNDLQNAIDTIVDSILVSELKSFRDRRIDDYLSVKDGVPRSIYVYGDLERDAFEISRRIEAADIVLDDYAVNHVPFDFDSVGEHDD